MTGRSCIRRATSRSSVSTSSATRGGCFYCQGPAGADGMRSVAFQHAVTCWEGSHLVGTTVNGKPQAQANIAILFDQSVENVDAEPAGAVARSDYGCRRRKWRGASASRCRNSSRRQDPAPFRIKSEANNLYAFGSGFDSPGHRRCGPDGRSNLTASAPVTFTVQFKVVDASLELNLFFKHWLTLQTGCVMTIQVNGFTIVRHVDALDAGSGADKPHDRDAAKEGLHGPRLLRLSRRWLERDRRDDRAGELVSLRLLTASAGDSVTGECHAE